MTDDQGSTDINCFGADDLITPNMDRLAADGVRFTQFYVGAPICSPSRATLMTGRYPQRAQLAGNAYAGFGMPTEQVTIAEMLKSAGYRTGLFGKWHLGENLPMSPNAQGFDEFLGHKVGCIDNFSHFFYWQGPNRHDLWKNEQEYFEDGSYFPDMTVREAQRLIRENSSRSFFLYLPFNMPHYPMQAEQRFVDMYHDMNDSNRKRYAAFVTALDYRIGQVVETLEEQGIRDNTLIIFLSDNGHSVEERAFGGGGSAKPYRGHKFTVWEGGVRLPCIISQPGRIARGEVRGQMVSSMDILPTIADYCGVPLPDRKIDGVSMKDVIETDTAKATHTVLHWESGNRWAVHEEQWKLVYEDDTLFLSDLSNDPGETNNLIDMKLNVAARLKLLHEQWAREVTTQ